MRYTEAELDAWIAKQLETAPDLSNGDPERLARLARLLGLSATSGTSTPEPTRESA